MIEQIQQIFEVRYFISKRLRNSFDIIKIQIEIGVFLDGSQTMINCNFRDQASKAKFFELVEFVK
jgi:hypothetical protein